MHVSQGSTYIFPYSIYGYQYFDQPLFCTSMSSIFWSTILYTSMSRSTKTSYINWIDCKPEVLTGYIYRITDSEGNNILVLQMITTRDGNNMKKQARNPRICPWIELLIGGNVRVPIGGNVRVPLIHKVKKGYTDSLVWKLINLK